MTHTFRHSVFVLAFVLVGCCAAQAQDEGKMQRLGSALSQLSPAVEAVVCCDPEEGGLSDKGVFERATTDNPKRLAPFAHYTLLLKRQGKHSAVLVCTPDGKTALLEDAGCTFKMEVHHWRDRPGAPCEFTLDLAKVCP